MVNSRASKHTHQCCSSSRGPRDQCSTRGTSGVAVTREARCDRCPPYAATYRSRTRQRCPRVVIRSRNETRRHSMDRAKLFPSHRFVSFFVCTLLIFSLYSYSQIIVHESLWQLESILITPSSHPWRSRGYHSVSAPFCRWVSLKDV